MLCFFFLLHSFLFCLNVLISVHTYFGALNRVRDGPFSSSRSARQSNSTWQASLWVTGDADAHFRETSWSDTALLAKQCGQGCAPHLLNKTATETTMSRDQVYMTSQPPQHGASYYTLSCIFSLRAERKVKESSLIHNSPTNHETIYVTQSFVFVLTFCII